MEELTTETRVIASLGELSDFAETLLDQLVAHEDKATILCLNGDLGAGKTTLTQYLAKHLGVAEPLSSPTFVIQKSYNIPESSCGFIELVHIDAYRLESGDQMGPLRFSDTLALPKTLVVIEWSENILSVLPQDRVEVQLKWIDETTRQISV